MQTYPLTKSQQTNASAQDLLTLIKSPTLVARRMSEILSAQQFIGLFLLSGRYTVQGGAIAVPTNETFRTERRAETVNPGAEYKLTPLSGFELEIYTAQKEGIATEITDEAVERLLSQPVDDAFAFLQTELVFNANELALGVIESAITESIAASRPWVGGDEEGRGRAIFRDALRAKAKVKALKLGYDIDTAVLPSSLYAEVIPDLLEILPKDSNIALTGEFPTIGGITWVAADGEEVSDPLFIDRRRFGGIARENIPSPEYRPVGGDTGVEVTSIREPKADKTRLQARNPHVPVVTNARAGLYLTGTGA